MSPTASTATHRPVSGDLLCSPADSGSQLSGHTEYRGRALVVHARGEVDACTLTAWKRMLRDASAVVTAPGPLVVDLTEVGFLSCRAFAVLAGEASRCRRHGVELRLVSTASIVARIVAAADLPELLPIHPDVEAAASAASPWHE
ncbi:anti-sigma factor antagonist [Nocardia blacklockiae]|uniref:anti-sigma factor antagonist n=1 Tax=Nocardia blacklockiae TaxID=480036 RepID=UPI001893F42F|nr:anti-sigma factor antagonist [Nocardia blacklockiae]MBF6175550.1 anti-sigma factor antagonist [Nocardia blacklockiae]